jgi:integrase
LYDDELTTIIVAKRTKLLQLILILNLHLMFMPKISMNQKFCDEIVETTHVKSEWFDRTVKGLYLEVRRTGVKNWRIRINTLDAGLRVIKIGDANNISYDQARKLAEDIRKTYSSRHSLGKLQNFSSKNALLSLKDFVSIRYLPYIKVRKKSAATDISMLKNHIIPKFGNQTFSEISREALVTFHLTLRERNYSYGYCDRIIILIRFIFNLAIKWDCYQGKNPATNFDLFKVNNERERYLNQQEIAVMLGNAEKSCNKDLLNVIKFLLMTGCRRGEALNAKWEHVDFKTKRFLIPDTKQGKPHLLPITDQIANFLKNLPSYNSSPFLFPNPATDRPYKSIFHSWNKVRRESGLAEVRIHDLRHSFASILVNNGRSLYEVQRLLGHSNTKMTQRYAHLNDKTLREAMEIISLPV